MKKLIIGLAIVLFYNSNLFGQCSVEVTENGPNTYFIANAEVLKEPRGSRSYIFYTGSLVKYETGSNDEKYTLQIAAAEHYNSNFAIPRKVNILFKDRGELFIEAVRMETKHRNSSTVYLSQFHLSPKQIEYFSNPILKMWFVDNRTDKVYDLIPDYKKVLVEQLDCINNQYSYRFGN